MDRWRPVVGYEGLYEISVTGAVRSLHTYGRGKRGKLMTPWFSPHGYVMTTLSRDGVVFVATVSRLVLHSFVSEPPHDKPYACHKDGDRCNNFYRNLYWGSNADNQKDRERHGTSNHGEANGMAKLVEADVRTIRDRLAKGDKQAAVARDYGVDPSAVSAIHIGRTWSNLV